MTQPWSTTITKTKASVPVRGGRHVVVQIDVPLRGGFNRRPPSRRRKGPSGTPRMQIGPSTPMAHANVEREGSQPSCQFDSPSFVTTSGTCSHGACAPGRFFFSDGPTVPVRLGLAQEETPSVVSEEVANDSSSNPDPRLYQMHTFLLL